MSDEPSGSPEVIIRNAGPPFADDDADIILRSCDNVDFHVHKLILSKASPVFKDMFSLPSLPVLPTESNLDAAKDGLVVVQMTENQHVLDLMLRFCYPVEKPPLDDVGDIAHTVEVTRKFDVAALCGYAGYRLIAHAPIEPERTFALAWALKLKDVVQLTARDSLRAPFLNIPSFPEADLIPSSAILRLLEYQHRCSQAVQALFASFTWLPEASLKSPIFEHAGPSACTCKREDATVQTRALIYHGGPFSTMHVRVPEWWLYYTRQTSLQLQKDVHESVVKSSHLLSKTIMRAMSCKHCKTDAALAMENFTEKLAEEIAAKISKIKLETPF